MDMCAYNSRYLTTNCAMTAEHAAVPAGTVAVAVAVAVSWGFRKRSEGGGAED